jgi:SNF2 family DNA or RNA helicase/uncharacterized Zn finger protein
MRQKFGTTLWGSYFLEAINKFYSYQPRIGRGKTYASVGKIADIEINSGKISAKVKGNYKPYYNVNLEFSEFSEYVRKKIIGIIEKNPLIIGEIINGKLPDAFLEELKKENISLFPEDWNKLKRHCNCPDWGDPCKHMAGVYFILASMVDKDPFLLFKLRGIDLISHFKLKEYVSLDFPIKIHYRDSDDINAGTDVKNSVSPSEGVPHLEPLEIEIVEFESFTPFILSKLASSPPFMQTDFKKLLEKFYKISSKFYPVSFIAEKKEGLEKIENLFKTGRIEFFAEKDIKSSYFVLYHELISKNYEKIKNILNDFGKIKKNKDFFVISPLNLCRLFLNFRNYKTDNKFYTYMYWLSRIAYLLIEANCFIPAVLKNEDDFFCVFRPPASPLSVRKQLSILKNITPEFAKFEDDKNYFDDDTANIFLLSSIYTEYAAGVKFELSYGLKDRLEPFIFNAIFKGIPLKTDNFEKQGFAKSIADYFSIFSLLESDVKIAMYVEKHKIDYVLRIKANDEFLYSIKDKETLINISRLITKFTDIIPEINRLMSVSEIKLSEQRLEEFILLNKNIIADLGIDIVLPKELKELLKPSIKMNVKTKSKNFKSFLSIGELLEYDFKIAIGEHSISRLELEKLLKHGRQLVKFRDQFVVLMPEEVKNLINGMDKSKKLSKYDLLQMKFSNEIEIDKKLNSFIDDMFSAKDFCLPKLNASLREYQLKGFNWALNNLLNGFGVVFADDMGLGKTLQTIALLKYLKDNKHLDGQTLITVPTTLLNNWESEILKFAPDLSYSFYYGQDRKIKKTERADIVFTTYSLLRRDIELLKQKNYSAIVIDEAQNIKNSGSLTAKAVKSIKAKYKIALSGTPVENNLSELWSIFDFALPNYLKTLNHFQENYAKPIEMHRDENKIAKLKQISSPFMIRRLKTDKSIIKDLPEKIISDYLITMGKEQAAIYKAVVDGIMKQIEKSDKASRSGLIFKLLISLKQVCNHPRNYDKKSPMLKDLSGKTKALMDMLDTILKQGEKVLIFTQYVEMGRILKSMIADELFVEPLFLEGSQSRTVRNGVLERFENSSEANIFILSIKAGGTGLNLTKANNVIHFDLWFNPAVENQATDRAFRIGQTKNVNVYRFITKNSFEEKIDKMIKSKQELSDLTVSSEETWIGKLDDEELRYIFS